MDSELVGSVLHGHREAGGHPRHLRPQARGRAAGARPTILSTGYNGSIRGMPHCDEVGHLMENGHCVATVHAEANAILQAAKNGVADRRGDHLHHRQPLLAVLQADRQRGLPADRVRRVLPGPAHLRVRGPAEAGAGGSRGAGRAGRAIQLGSSRSPCCRPEGVSLRASVGHRTRAPALTGTGVPRLAARITDSGLTVRPLPKSRGRRAGRGTDKLLRSFRLVLHGCEPGAAPPGRNHVDAGALRRGPRLMDSLVHDVRNPLNALAINLEVLNEKSPGETAGAARAGEEPPGDARADRAGGRNPARSPSSRAPRAARRRVDLVRDAGRGCSRSWGTRGAGAAQGAAGRSSRASRRGRGLRELGFLVLQPVLRAIERARVGREVA